jgi:tetratricopeptide (TPR) repeat protein
MDFEDLPLEPLLASPDSLAPAALDVLLHEISNSAAREAQAAMAQYRLLKRLDDRPAMRQVLVRAIKFAPDLLIARLKISDLFLEEGDLLQAREHAEAAQRIAPDDRQVERLLRRVERGTPRGALRPRRQAVSA